MPSPHATETDRRNAAEIDRAVAARRHARERLDGPCPDPLCCICVPDPAGDDAYAAEYAEFLRRHTPDMGEADPAAELSLADYAASREWETAPRTDAPAVQISDDEIPW